MPSSDDTGARPEREYDASTSEVLRLTIGRVDKLETAFVSLTSTAAGMANTLMGIDKKLDADISAQGQIRQRVDVIEIERAREAGARGAVEKIRGEWVTPWVTKALMGLLFAGLVAFTSRVAAPTVPSAAEIGAAVRAALKMEKAAP